MITKIGKESFINLTPHEINLYEKQDDDNPVVTIPPSGYVARVDETNKTLSYLVIGDKQIATTETRFSEVYFVDDAGNEVDESRLYQLVPGADNATWITSMMVKQAEYATLDSVVSPGLAVRDDKGRIKGVTSLRRRIC